VRESRIDSAWYVTHRRSNEQSLNSTRSTICDCLFRIPVPEQLAGRRCSCRFRIRIESGIHQSLESHGGHFSAFAAFLAAVVRSLSGLLRDSSALASFDLACSTTRSAASRAAVTSPSCRFHQSRSAYRRVMTPCQQKLHPVFKFSLDFGRVRLQDWIQTGAFDLRILNSN
jgi:hypothetical protein